MERSGIKSTTIMVVALAAWVAVGAQTSWAQDLTCTPGMACAIQIPGQQAPQWSRRVVLQPGADHLTVVLPDTPQPAPTPAPVPPPSDKESFLSSLRHHLLIGFRASAGYSALPGMDGGSMNQDRIDGWGVEGALVLSLPNFLVEGLGVEMALGAGYTNFGEDGIMTGVPEIGLLWQSGSWNLVVGYVFTVGAASAASDSYSDESVLQSHAGLVRIGYQWNPRLRLEAKGAYGWAKTARVYDALDAEPVWKHYKGNGESVGLGVAWTF